MAKFSHSAARAFTLVELLTATALGYVLALGLIMYASFATRLIARNSATNHSHDTVRGSTERMMADLHDAASTFRLVDFDGTTYSDASPAVTSDLDPYTGQYLSGRSNGVRFFRV